MSLQTFFKKIKPVTDSEEQLRLHLLWYLLIRVVLYTLLIGIAYVLQSSERQLIMPSQLSVFFFLITIYAYSILSALLLKKKGLNFRRYGKIQVLSDSLFITLLVYATGASQSIFTPVYILPIMAGGLILHRIGALIPAAASTILYGSVLTLEYLQIIPQYYSEYRYIIITEYEVSTSIFAVYGLTFFLIALLSGLLARKLRTTEDALSLTEMKFDRLLLLYKQIFDDIVTGIITLDINDRITSFNPAVAAITGYGTQEVFGRRLQNVFPELSSEKHERDVIDFKRKDGKVIRIGYTCSELHMTGTNLFDDPSFSSNRVITMQDISQLEEMEQQVRNAEKMAAIGELSASIAHDFRNPLAAIFGSAQILAMDTDSTDGNNPSTQVNLTNIILRESERMANTITDFLHYAQPVNPQLKMFNLYDLMQETINYLQNEVKVCAGKIFENYVPGEIEIMADRQLLQIALTHVLKNSCYFSDNSSDSIVCTSRLEVENQGVVIEVADRGKGIDPEIRDTAFEPFVTSREDSSGLGLAIVRQIILSHGGDVQIFNRQGKGCRVRIHLPYCVSTH